MREFTRRIGGMEVKMRNRRSPWLFVLLLLAGALVGGLMGEYLSRFAYFSWMSFGGVNGYRDLFAFSLHPALDVRVLRLGFDVALGINGGSILGMLLAIILFFRL